MTTTFSKKNVRKQMINYIKECALSLVGGIIVGSLFSFVKLPIPAPPEIKAVFGIVGITLGYLGFNYIKGVWFS